MSTAIPAIGTTLSIGGEAIAQMMDISGPALTTDTEDITNHSSPDGWEEFIPTIKRTGEVTFPLVFLPGSLGHEALITAQDDRSIEEFEMRYPGTDGTPGEGGGWDFDGLVTGFSMGSAVTSYVSADVTIKPTGSITRVLPS